MRIKNLEFTNLRLVEHLEVLPARDINIIYGPNGSGKSSLLEGIHLLAVGRSFRTHQMRHIVRQGSDQVTSFGQIEDTNPDQGGPIGVARSLQGELRIRHRGQDIGLSDLAGLMPVQLIDSTTFNLLEGAPSVRRQFLDWGSFHQNRSFIGIWRAFQRALKQRNSLLKYGKIDDSERELWDREFCDHAKGLTELRTDYLERLQPIFGSIAKQLVDLEELELRFSVGYDKSCSLNEQLVTAWERDTRQGFTTLGPQRADLKLKVAGRDASEHLSRGQKKLVVSALKLAQGQLYSREHKQGCVYLVDDLPSELDKRHLRTFCEFLQGSGSQCFITCVDPAVISDLWHEGIDGCFLKLEEGRLVDQQAFGDWNE